MNGNGSAQAFTSLAAGSNPKFVVIDHTTGCVSDTFSCSNAVTECPAISATAASRTTALSVAPQQVSPTLKAYPNPFSDKVEFVVNVPRASDARLDIFNAMGQKIKTVFEGHLNAGNQTFELTVPKKQQLTLIYVFRVGDQKLSGKLLQLNN